VLYCYVVCVFCVILSSLFSYMFDYSFGVLMLLVGSFDL